MVEAGQTRGGREVRARGVLLLFLLVSKSPSLYPFHGTACYGFLSVWASLPRLTLSLSPAQS